jgi:hypothetical protein
MRRVTCSLCEGDCVKGCGGGADFRGDLFVVNNQLGSAFLDMGGVHLRLGFSR